MWHSKGACFSLIPVERNPFLFPFSHQPFIFCFFLFLIVGGTYDWLLICPPKKSPKSISACTPIPTMHHFAYCYIPPFCPPASPPPFQALLVRNFSLFFVLLYPFFFSVGCADIHISPFFLPPIVMLSSILILRSSPQSFQLPPIPICI